MKHKLIFETLVGSTVYGTSTPQSDIDKKGVYIQTFDEILAWGYEPQVNVTKDEAYFEVRRFLELLEVANPTALEMLFTPDKFVTFIAPEFELIRKNRNKFLTKMCAKSFGNYGYSQIAKATGTDKKMNWEKSRISKKVPLDFIFYSEGGKSFSFKDFLTKNNLVQENCGLVRLEHMKDQYALYYDYDNLGYRGIIGKESNEIRLSSVPKGEESLLTIYYNVEAYSKYCKEYREYKEWLEKRNMARFVDNKSHNQMVDGKNLLHCRRLVDIAIEIAKEKTINVFRPNAAYLLSIKRGEVNLKEILSVVESDIKDLDRIYEESGLPDKCDKEFVTSLLLEIRHYEPMKSTNDIMKLIEEKRKVLHNI